MTYCQNCGHESHCGIVYKREERNGRGEFIEEVIVCKHCRCELCTDTKKKKPDWHHSKWPGPGV